MVHISLHNGNNNFGYGSDHRQTTLSVAGILVIKTPKKEKMRPDFQADDGTITRLHFLCVWFGFIFIFD